MFTLHVGEYLVGEYIERKYRHWNVWLPSKDTGIDLLVSEAKNQKTVSIQVKFSKDFNPTHGSRLAQSSLLASGWWTYDPKKIQESQADFWVLVLPSFVEKRTSFIILPPAELLRRLRTIHGTSNKRIQSYVEVTKTKRCWETRGLTNADQELVAHDRYTNVARDFTAFLDAWDQIKKRLE